MKKYTVFFAIIVLILGGACSTSSNNPIGNDDIIWKPSKPSVSAIKKPKFLWVDAPANFNDFANNKEKIAQDLKLVKKTGFTDIVIDIRPAVGGVLFKTSVQAPKVEWLTAWVNGEYKKVNRTATWDYLDAFVEVCKELDLKIHAGFNAMNGGYKDELGESGILYKDPSKREWATFINTKSGIINTMDLGDGSKFFNPSHPEVQKYLCSLLEDLARYDLDGIFIDRGRFEGMYSDFSELSKEAFQKHIGKTGLNFPDDVMKVDINNKIHKGPLYKQWLEFRVKVIHDFMLKAKESVKKINPNMKFGVYVGGWYSSYTENGVNWASKSYNTSSYFPDWATKDYSKYGIADMMDQMLIGAYASPLNVYGSGEWTMEGFCKLAKEKTKNSCPMVAGGPDIGNWDPDNKVSESAENQAIVNSVKACIDACDGYFLFDMIHLKMGNKWKYVKEGIEKAHKEND